MIYTQKTIHTKRHTYGGTHTKKNTDAGEIFTWKKLHKEYTYEGDIYKEGTYI